MSEVRTGPTDSLVDVGGLAVGHAQRRGDGWLTGTTVVLAPPGGACAGVDVRGGGPGTRETDLLDPRALVDRVDAVVLTGGSAFGLASADGVMRRLAEDGRGLPVGGGEVVPIVPAAVIYDLGRGGAARRHPDAALGAQAYDAARGAEHGPVAQGVVGAGTGAKAGALKGGVGSASLLLPDGTTVAALVVVNAVGSCVDPDTGELLAARLGPPGLLPGLRRPDPAEVARARDAGLLGPAVPPPVGGGQATTLGVVATDATLDKARCAKVAGLAHDGMARAIRPVHTMLDGDTVFALATGARPSPDLPALQSLLEAAGDVFARAVAAAMLAAESVRTPAGDWPAYAEVLPSCRGAVR